jgi:excisionase family DNA binding protein
MGRRRPFVGDRLLTVGEVAATMRVSNMTVYRLIKNGSLAAVRVGKNYRIRESEVDRYLSERSVQVDFPPHDAATRHGDRGEGSE